MPAPPAASQPVAVNEAYDAPGLVVTVEDDRPSRVSVIAPAPRKGNALAIASLVIGVIAASVCWIPFLGMVAKPLGILGCILGVPGVLLSLPRDRSGFPAAAMGLGLSMGSAVYAFHVTNQAVESIRAALKTPPPVVAQPEKAAADDAPVEWVAAPAPARIGAISASVTSARISTIQLKALGSDPFESSERYLILTVEVTNESANKKASYRSWGERSLITFGDDSVKLADNFGNNYNLIGAGFTSQIVGRVAFESLYPGKGTSDVLVFEVPVDGVNRLDLTLPASHVGESGVYRFRIGAAQISQ